MSYRGRVITLQSRGRLEPESDDQLQRKINIKFEFLAHIHLVFSSEERDRVPLPQFTVKSTASIAPLTF